MVQINENKMTPEQFVYWLQGFCEMTEQEPTSEQWQMIREHLQQVFTKELYDTWDCVIDWEQTLYPLKNQPQYIC